MQPTILKQSARRLCVSLRRRLLPLCLVGVMPLVAGSKTAIPAISSKAFVSATTQRPSPTKPAKESTEKSDPFERKRDRLLHLKNGSVLRGASRMVAGHWEVRLGKSWTSIPASLVERVVEERALLSEAKRLASKLKRDDHDARITHARWLAEQGLFSECLGAVDRVLKADPDFKAALQFLAERPVRIQWPSMSENLALFLAAASRSTASGRELAIEELKGFRDRAGLTAQLAALLRSERDECREFAALIYRRLFPGEGLPELLQRAVLDRSPAVRANAALALRDANNPEVAEPVIRALSSKYALLRQNAASALGAMNYAVAVKPLISALAAAAGSDHRAPAANIFVGTQTAYVQDFDVEVAQFEGIANPKVNVLSEGAVLDVRVSNLTSITKSSQRRNLRNALFQLTGVKVSNSQKAWQKWWDKHGAEWISKRR